MTIKDPSKGRGAFVRRSEISSLVAAAMKGTPSPEETGLGDNEIRLKNATGSNHDIFSVFHVGNSILTPDNNESGYKFGIPTHAGEEIGEDDDSAIAVVQVPSNDGKMAIARAAGITLVRLTGETGKTHATTREGEHTLEAADSGPCVILYDPGPDGEERIARVRIGGGGGGGCESQWRLIVFGGPTGGTFKLPVSVPDPSDDDNMVTEMITISWSEDSDGIASAFASHSLIDPEDVSCNFFGGNLPTHEAVIYLPDGIEIGAPPALDFLLTGGTNVHILLRKCCG